MNRWIAFWMKLFKPIRWLIAKLVGYFWLPCPICGENFGGFEWKRNANLYVSRFKAKGVCPACVTEARRRNEIMVGQLREVQVIENAYTFADGFAIEPGESVTIVF